MISRTWTWNNTSIDAMIPTFGFPSANVGLEACCRVRIWKSLMFSNFVGTDVRERQKSSRSGLPHLAGEDMMCKYKYCKNLGPKILVAAPGRSREGTVKSTHQIESTCGLFWIILEFHQNDKSRCIGFVSSFLQGIDADSGTGRIVASPRPQKETMLRWMFKLNEMRWWKAVI